MISDLIDNDDLRSLLSTVARRKLSDGAKRRTAHVISTMRRLDNGDDGRQGRRGYCVRVGGSAPGMTTVASDGGGSGDDEKSLWL